MGNEDYFDGRQPVPEEEIIQEGEWIPPRETQSPEQARWELSPDDIIEQIEHELRGEDLIRTKDGGMEWIKKGEAVMNEKGVRAVVSVIKKYINKISFLSNLSEEQIYFLCLWMANDLTQLIFNNGDNFDMDFKKGYQIMIVNSTSDMVFIGLMKAMGQGERKYRGSVERILRRIDESSGGNEPKKKFGLFG